MTTQTLVLLLLGAVIAVFAGLALRTYFRMRGARVVVCPETRAPAGVTVDATHAALSALRETPDIRLGSCTRWPEREECDQACVAQIVAAPEETLATNMLTRWYTDRLCAICDRAVPPVRSGEPRPGLLDPAAPERRILGWEDIPADQLPAALESHLPVCSNCFIAESFRQQFPDRVTDRAPTEKRDLAVH